MRKPKKLTSLWLGSMLSVLVGIPLVCIALILGVISLQTEISLFIGFLLVVFAWYVFGFMQMIWKELLKVSGSRINPSCEREKT